MTPTENDLTGMLDQLQAGDGEALERLFPLVYEELHDLAHRQRRKWQGDETVGTTVLVHELYLKLAAQKRLDVRNRAHFFAVAARAMRQILSNYARARRRQKRGGDARKVPLAALPELPAVPAFPDEYVETMAALDSALSRLEQEDSRLSRVVECRFFGGMSIDDTARVVGTSPATVKRDWALARAWLYRTMEPHRVS